MYNIALAIAIAISSFMTLGSKVLLLFIPAEATRMLPLFLQLGLNFTANYLIPSVIIYLIFRAIKAERFFKATTGIHILLALVNIQLLYGGLLMYASSIRGGGPSFVLMNLGAKINPFFQAILIIGLSWLFIRSLLCQDDTMCAKYKSIFKSASGIFASITLIVACVFWSGIYIKNREKILIVKEKKQVYETKLRTIRKRYDELCKTAKGEIFQRVNKPNSLYTTSLNSYYKIMLKHFDYVEIKGLSTKIERLTIKEGRKNKKHLDNEDIIKAPITEITSRYHYIQSKVKNEADNKIGIFKTKFSIIDTQTKKTLATYFEVWSRDLKTRCSSGSYDVQMSTIKYVFNISDEISEKFIIHSSQ